jgi:hypothetical protein
MAVYTGFRNTDVMSAKVLIKGFVQKSDFSGICETNLQTRIIARKGMSLNICKITFHKTAYLKKIS